MKSMCYLCFVIVMCLTTTAQGQANKWCGPAQENEWCGLVIAEENRCSPYERASHYRHSQRREAEIIEAMDGRIYAPYTGKTFTTAIGQDGTDIEHIVATSEAHDSGLCRQDIAVRKAFANDLLNLTLASPYVNRQLKRDKDAASWVPEKNQCWFAHRVVLVRQKYNLTIDRQEAEALDAILRRCESTELIFYSNLSPLD